MNRLIAWSVLAVLGLGFGQTVVPGWVAEAVARAVQARDGGARPTVALTALPFWLLAAGDFQRVALSAPSLTLDGLDLHAARLIWTDGAVNPASLKRGSLQIERRGAMTMAFTVTAGALARFLEATARLKDSQVSVSPKGIRVAGIVLIGGKWVPLAAQGRLGLADRGEGVVFHPTRIDGAPLPIPTTMDVFNLRRLDLPVALKFKGMVLSHNQIRFRAMSS